jgi:hypothetical protein
MVEYAAIIAVLAGTTITDLISFEATWNVILMVGGFILCCGFFVFKY